jgi:hypothetical protein
MVLTIGLVNVLAHNQFRIVRIAPLERADYNCVAIHFVLLG